jgi:hypothetical protein
MEIVVALGRIYGAADLVPVASVQVAGVSYKNLGEAGLQFLQAWAAQGAGPGCRPPSTRPAWTCRPGASWALKRSLPGASRPSSAPIPPWASARLHLHSLPGRPRPAPRPAHRLGRVLGGQLCQFRPGCAHQPRGRAQRPGRGHCRPHGPLWPAPGRGPAGDGLVDVRCPIRSEADLGALGYLVGRQVGRTACPSFRLSTNLCLPPRISEPWAQPWRPAAPWPCTTSRA